MNLSPSVGDDYDFLLLAALESQYKRCENIIERFRRHNDLESLEIDYRSPAYRKYLNACAMQQALSYYIKFFAMQIVIESEV